MKQLAAKVSTLATIFSTNEEDAKRPMVACTNLTEMTKMLQLAIENYQVTFARSLSEIQQLRS